jgi:PKD repeat protein
MGVYYRPNINTYSNSVFKNNIVLEEYAGRVPIFVESSHPGLTFEHNCWNKTPLATAQGIGDVIADPKLAKAGSTSPRLLSPEWFKILENSPARDQAVVINTVINDFYKTPRGSAPDMGAIELTAEPSSLVATASGTPISGQTPLTVDFSGDAQGGIPPYSYRWTFGDGSSSTSKSPTHIYSSAGTYTATLTVTDSASATAKDSVNIDVSASTPLSIDITASTNSGQAPLTIAFTSSASGGLYPYSYNWKFGDGANSTDQNPSHTYTSSGNYTATLTVTDSAKSEVSDSVAITVTSSTTTQKLSLSVNTGQPSPGNGGTTNPAPGNHSYSQSSSVSVSATPNANYRFSLWKGNISAANAYERQITVLMDSDKSLSANFCTRCGDATGDLIITVADAQAAFEIFLHKISHPSECQIENADVNCNGSVTPADAQAIFHKYLGKDELPADCSKKTRTMSAGIIPQRKEDVSATLIVEDVRVNPEGYAFVPIIIEGPVDMDAFGFDLAFLSNVLTYLALEKAELTEKYDYLDANVIPAEAPKPGRTTIEADVTDKISRFRSVGRKKPFKSFTQPDFTFMNQSILRVGGYRADPNNSDSSGLLVTLVFKVIEEFVDPIPLSIVSTYDDIQYASVINGVISPR